MNINNLIGDLENGFSNAAKIKSSLVERVLIPLVPNVEGFEPPQSFGVYRETGGQPFGVVGKDYNPINLNRLFDTIESSILNCGVDNLDVSKLEFKEYFGGKKVSFDIPFKTLKVSSGAENDYIDTKINFLTGFDGLTKTSINFFTYRQICSNGMKGWANDLSLSFKNTKGNNGKELLICEEIFKVINGVEDYKEQLNKLATIKIDRRQMKEFISKLTGYDVVNPTSTRQANILDDLIASIEKEMSTTGQTAYSLLQGVTRHTSHYKAKGEISSMMFETSNAMNQKAMQLVSIY
jgi:hypothetical protein